MADRTGIEWTDATWNPVRGCSRVSPGCQNCYAERVASRFSDEGQPYHGLAKRTADGPRWTGEMRLIESQLGLPLRWKRPRRIFVNSMSDLFHERLDGADILRVFSVMERATQHTFQVLTKRAEGMRDFLRSSVPLTNVWLGVSVEDQKRAEERIPLLLQTPAAVRFLSVEPLLGPVDISPWLAGGINQSLGAAQSEWRSSIDWVILGAESGPGRREMRRSWAETVIDQCRAAGVPVFFKQAIEDGKLVKLPTYRGQEWSQYPAVAS